MKIKKKNKLWVSFLGIVIIPIILSIFGAVFYTMVQLRQYREVYNIEGKGIYPWPSSFQALSNSTMEEYEEIVARMKDDSEDFLKDASLRNMNERLQKKQSALVVRIGNNITFDGTGDHVWGVELPAYGNEGKDATEDIFTGDKGQILIKQIDSNIPRGQCSIFILTDTSAILPEVQNIVMGVAIAVLLLILVTGICLILWTYKGIIGPIRKLREATQQIREGNLDFSIEVDSEDEIGELCADFEQMRKRLKESAEEKLAQDQEERILISNICHDLKTPITSIQGYVEGLMDGVANTPEKQEKYIKTIHSKANELNHLINELTIYSKLDTNRVPYNFQKLNVEAYFRDCMEELKMDLESQNVELGYFNYAKDDILIIADPEQLSRVIQNIVGNAVKYMNKPRRIINFRIKDVGDFIQVEVEDNGKGIASKDLPYIFERFFRADSSRNETRGNGIGLSIVRKILDDHGGKIWATSKEGVGTTMYFVIRKYQEVPNE